MNVANDNHLPLGVICEGIRGLSCKSAHSLGKDALVGNSSLLNVRSSSYRLKSGMADSRNEHFQSTLR